MNIDHYKDIRKELHSIPELGYNESKTAQLITRELDRLGVDYEKNIAKTGIVAWIRKGDSQKSIALRADMDALAMVELNDIPYKSTHQNCMHGCGHDGHSAMLLGAIDAIRDLEFDGTVYFIFQPAEEGGAGAKAMIDDGLFDRFQIDKVFAIHNQPIWDFGKFYIKKGAVMSSIDTFRIEIEGKSSHSSMPHTGLNPIVVASHIVLALKSIPTLDINPNEPSVISVTKIHSGDAINIIPSHSIIEGSIRTYSRDTQKLIKDRVEKISKSISESFNTTAKFRHKSLYPAVINRDVNSSIKSATESVGEENIVTDYISSFASEDFSFFLEEREGSFVWLGTKPNGKKATPLHSQNYDFNDDIIEIGVRYWVNLVKIELS